jgi:hypothetical protein
MIDIEEQVRSALERASGSPAWRPIPENTVRRIRRRQAATAMSVFAGVAGLILAVSMLAAAIPRRAADVPSSDPSATTAPPAFRRNPLPLADGAWPEVTYGGDFQPYVDNDLSEHLVGDKLVVSYGVMQGVPWSLTGYDEVTGGSQEQADTGHCAELFFGTGDPGDTRSGAGLGGSAGCYTPAGGGDPLVVVNGEQITADIADFYGYFSPEVASIELRFADGTVRDLDTIPGPGSQTQRYFILFTPASVAGPQGDVSSGSIDAGTLIALDASGDVLAHAPLCMGTYHDGTNASCVAVP